jgi:hypothetical protein
MAPRLGADIADKYNMHHGFWQEKFVAGVFRLCEAKRFFFRDNTFLQYLSINKCKIKSRTFILPGQG